MVGVTLLRKCKPSKAVVELIGKACARNVPAELHFEDAIGELITGRVRLLEMADGLVLADRPMILDDDGAIPDGSTVTVHFTLNGSRYQFESILEESGLSVLLNAHQRVSGISLRQPFVLTDSQRRCNLRVSVLGYDPISIMLVEPHPEITDACPIDAHIIAGWIVDVSAGGASVLLQQDALPRGKSGQHFYLNFMLPAVEHEFSMLGVVRNFHRVESSESMRLGIKFRPWRGRIYQRDQHRISRFVTAHERRLLKRRK